VFFIYERSRIAVHGIEIYGLDGVLGFALQGLKKDHAALSSDENGVIPDSVGGFNFSRTTCVS